MSRKLPNYLRMYRKRSGLSQDEIALLLGYPNGQQISRYEGFMRQPPLKTILAYEAIFGVPVRDLLAGPFEQEVTDIQERARLLKEKLQKGKPDRRTVRKLELLQTIAS